MDSCLPLQNVYWLNPVKNVTKLQVPQDLVNFLTNHAAVRFSTRSSLYTAGCSVSTGVLIIP